MRFLISTIFLLVHTLYVLTQYIHHKTPTNKDLHLHENSEVHGAGNYFASYNVGERSLCAHYCALEHGKCKSANVYLQKNGSFECYLYQSAGTIKSTADKTKSVISFMPSLEKSSYCEDLDYLNICGSCICKNQHGEKRMPYVCDCSYVTPIRKDCKDYHDNGHIRSGIYAIMPNKDIKAFQVFCTMRKKDKALTLVFRRIDKVKYPSGFDRYNNSDAIPGDHMIGVEYIHQLTNALKMDLYVEYEHFGGYLYTATFNDFTVASEDDDYKYDYTRYHTTGSVFHRFFTHHVIISEKSSASFTNCSGEFHWWFCWHNNNKYYDPAFADYGVVMYLKRSDQSSDPK